MIKLNIFTNRITILFVYLMSRKDKGVYVMKKILFIFMMLISITLISCSSEEIESEFVDIVESEDAVFTVKVDTLSFNSVDDWVEVNIKIKTKNIVSRPLPTTSYGEEYVIQMRNQNIENEDMRLNTTGTTGNCAVGGAYLKKDEKLERTLGIYIDSFFLGEKQPSFLNGEYRIYVQLYGDEEWIETDLVITVDIAE